MAAADVIGWGPADARANVLIFLWSKKREESVWERVSVGGVGGREGWLDKFSCPIFPRTGAHERDWECIITHTQMSIFFVNTSHTNIYDVITFCFYPSRIGRRTRKLIQAEEANMKKK